ncbi:glycosyltransferase family 4 protein [Aquimarina sp. 2201CG1-2-11]|uniref:glycosyltransferase family 4 protein n=1 Tax=Aquimarina discodermiae TaxID=3231043 RepID=UPI0034635E6C
MKIVDISYHSSHWGLSTSEYLKISQPNIGYASQLPNNYTTSFVFHSKNSETIVIDEVTYIFKQKSTNSKIRFPFRLSSEIRKLQPDAILVHSLTYLHFAAFLRLFLPKKIIILVQHHGELPTTHPLKKKIIQWSDHFIDGYLFTAKSLGLQWVHQKLISSPSKIFEVMEGSSHFKYQEEIASPDVVELGKKELTTFLWVGRLDTNKDPICTLKAFRQYRDNGNHFRLYMFYHTTELLEEISNFIKKNELQDVVFLKGKITHHQLEQWYNWADYFILASHREAGGYALCEAMACGCIPIVTHIPSFAYMVKDNYSGLLFEPGNSDDLYQKLKMTNGQDKTVWQHRVLETFNERLSFQAIANGIVFTIETLLAKK